MWRNVKMRKKQSILKQQELVIVCDLADLDAL